MLDHLTLLAVLVTAYLCAGAAVLLLMMGVPRFDRHIPEARNGRQCTAQLLRWPAIAARALWKSRRGRR